MTVPISRRSLLLGCALAALSAGGEQAAQAQAFNATPTVVAGGVVIDRGTPGVDTITVSTPSAIIDWNLTFSAPAPDPIVFLPAGNTGIFQNSLGNPNFAILNRIIPVGTSRVRMDGTVIGRLQTAAGNVPGGTVVFSSPTGLIIGSTVVFDVGNLLLTTLDVAADGNGNFFVGGGLQLRGGELFPDAAIVTEAGSTFTAPSETSWIAMVAPRIDHNGAVRVNGAAAYVAAEAVDITINAGLFDINIIAGTTAADAIVHRGSTGGPASSAAGDNHRIYMAASSQGQAMTLLLAGSAGFDPAVSAAVENGAIVLSAGHNIVGGTIEEAPVDGTSPGSFRIGAANITSDLFGRARTDFIVGDTGAGTLTATQDVSISAFGRAEIRADAGFLVHIDGNASVSAANTTPISISNASAITGGEAAITASEGGRIEIVGNATVDASATGAQAEDGTTGPGTGGNARATADAGTIDIGGSLTVLSVGRGVNSAGLGLDLGTSGTGGNAFASALTGGSLHVAGGVRIDASGTGTDGSGAVPGVGTSGTGGAGRIEALTGGTVKVDGASAISANGAGGGMGTGAGNSGGTGQGGTASVLAAGGNIDLTGPVTLAADGNGGGAPAGGTGQGGVASVEGASGRATIGGALVAHADGRGGDALFDPGGRGGNGTGGTVIVNARSADAAGVVTGNAATLTASGTGGTGGIPSGGSVAGRGGDGTGGSVSATAEAGNARLQLGALTASSLGTGGNGGSRLGFAGGPGGDGRGGTVTAGTIAPKLGAPFTGRADYASVALNASGTGGSGGVGTPTGPAGAGAGGTTTLISTGTAAAVAGQAILTANGTGNTGAGGEVALTSIGFQGAPGSLTAGTVTGTSAVIGIAAAGNVLGRWIVTADGGSIQFGSATLNATASGTPGVATPSQIVLNGSTVTVAGTGTFSTDGEARIVATGSGRLVGGDIAVNGRTGILVTHVGRAPGARTVDAARFAATTAVDYIAAAGTSVLGRTSVDIVAGRNASLAETVGTANLNVTAGGIAQFNAAADGRAISVTSADIDVAAGARVGNAGTVSVLLQVQPNANATTLGGTAAGPGYTLTQAEAGRVRGDLVRVTALGGAAGPAGSNRIVVGDLSLAGTAAPNGIGAFEIATPGTVRVDGALLLANAGAADRIGVTANRVEVATGAGSIRVRDAAGAPAGSLALTAGDIWVADAATLARLAADPNYAGRDADLQANDGADRPRGSVEAGAIRLAPLRTLFVRNSGTPAAYAGITVGAGGLQIVPSGAVPATVTAFGRRLNADGSFTINIPFYLQVDFKRGTAPGYTNASEFNRCLINAGQCGGDLALIPGRSRDFTGGPFGQFPIPPQEPPGQLIDPTDFLAEPLIEEPVTSGADSTLWAQPADDDDDDDDDVPHVVTPQ